MHVHMLPCMHMLVYTYGWAQHEHAHAHAHAQVSKEEIDEVFDTFDHDRSGSISLKEMTKAHTHTCTHTHRRCIHAIPMPTCVYACTPKALRKRVE